MQDVLTDITVSMKKLERADIGFDGAYIHGVSIIIYTVSYTQYNIHSVICVVITVYECMYIHSLKCLMQGMYQTAIKIKHQLLDENKPILRTACKNNNVRSKTLFGIVYM